MMNSKEEIVKLINQYSFTIDSGDLEGFAALFEKGEWIFANAEAVKGKDLKEKVLDKIILYDDGTPRTRHMTTNMDIEIDEALGVATCTRYVFVVQQTEQLPLQVIYSGEYKDEFARNEKEQWYYKRLKIEKPFFGELKNHLTNAL